MQCTYEFELYRGERNWIIEAYDFPACITQGEDVEDACESAADILREFMHDALLDGASLPKSTFGHEPRNGGVSVIVSVDTTLDSVRKVSATEAAQMLGVGRSRVTAMLEAGRLDGWREGRNTWVTLDSVESRLEERPRAGRPRKEKTMA